MRFVKASESDLDLVYDIVSESINYSLGKSYNNEIVDFFLNVIHTKQNVLNDILNNDLWILEDEGDFVGTGFARGNHISLVYIRPEFQHKGYGNVIMDYLENIIFSNNYITAILDPTKDAIGFYEGRGYTLISHEDTYLPSGTYLAHDIMEKRLNGF